MSIAATIRDRVPGFTGKIAAHSMGWFGDGNVHRSVPYLSNNPYTIARKLSLMQSAGIQAIIQTWQGPLATFQHSTAVQTCIQAGERGLDFMLLLDPWSAKLGKAGASLTQNVIAALQHADTQAMFNAPGYCPQKYVLNFNTKADLGAVAKAFPTLQFLDLGVGYSWVNIPLDLAGLQRTNAQASMRIPGVFASFNDAGKVISNVGGVITRDYSQSVWGGPARVIDGQAGKTLFDVLAVTPPRVPYIAIVTWDDYDEQSSGPMEHVAAVEFGVQIT